MKLKLEDVQNVLSLLVDVHPLPKLGTFDDFNTRIERGLEFKHFIAAELRKKLATLAPDNMSVDEVLPLRSGTFSSYTSREAYERKIAGAVKTIDALITEAQEAKKEMATKHYSDLKNYFRAALIQYKELEVFSG